MNTYRITCEVMYTFPIGKYTWFGRTAKISHKYEQTYSKRTVMFSFKAPNTGAAIIEAENRINRMKAAYIADGWGCTEMSGGGLIFFSDKDVFNHYLGWKLEYEISGRLYARRLEEVKR